MAYVRPGNLPNEPNQETIYPPPVQPERRVPVESREERTTERVFVGGSSVETICGIGAVVLAIIGITGFQQTYMLAAAAIVAGVALVAQGGSIAARWNDVLRRLDGERFDRSELIGGIGTEVFGGVVGIALGILAFAGVIPEVLLPVAAIVFGGSLLLGGAAQPDLEELVPESDPRYRRYTRDAIQASGGVMVMVGIAAAVLGILALLKVGPLLTLSLVAMLCVGAALLVGGGALTARFARRLRTV